MSTTTHKTVLKSLGKRIRELRKVQNLTQSQLAFESDITRELLTKIEAGKINTTMKTLTAIAAALSVKVKELFEFEG